jgi:hypothetical protein
MRKRQASWNSSRFELARIIHHPALEAEALLDVLLWVIIFSSDQVFASA